MGRSARLDRDPGVIPAVALPGGFNKHRLLFPAPAGPISLDQINDADRSYLRELAQNAKLVIDVGTFFGGSAETMLEAMPTDGRLITIDTFQGSPVLVLNAEPHHLLRYAHERLARFADRSIIMVGDSRFCASLLPKSCADLVFIDAAHDYENVKADIDAWLPIIKPGGVMAGHDFDRRAPAGFSYTEIVARSKNEWDRASGVHCGVVTAVLEAFESVNVPKNDDGSSIWTARPEWRKQT